MTILTLLQVRIHEVVDDRILRVHLVRLEDDELPGAARRARERGVEACRLCLLGRVHLGLGGSLGEITTRRGGESLFSLFACHCKNASFGPKMQFQTANAENMNGKEKAFSHEKCGVRYSNKTTF